jgi:hypothetical protein
MLYGHGYVWRNLFTLHISSLNTNECYKLTTERWDIVSSKLGRCQARISDGTPSILVEDGFPQSFQTNAGVVSWHRPPQFPSIFFLVHSSIILPSNAIQNGPAGKVSILGGYSVGHSIRSIPNGVRDWAISLYITHLHEQHAMSLQELQSALMLMVHCTR